MAVPEEIRKVPRPKNTVVLESKSSGPLRYAVRERRKSVYKKGGNPSPRNGAVVGHIIDGEFRRVVPPTPKGPSSLCYGTAALVKSFSHDILDDLLEVFQPEDAYSIMVAASLKVLRPSISSARMESMYQKTFFSSYYPGTNVSRNKVSDIYTMLGERDDLRRSFYQRRLAAVCKDHHVAIDGMLKQDSSTVNDLSAYSRKSRVKGVKEISVLYAYDLELMEPVCAKVFPGNMIDPSSYPAFIRECDIKRGIIIADKGFPPSQIKDELAERPDLHFLTPLKRNDKRIAKYSMTDFQGVLKGIDGKVQYKKQDIGGGRFLYAFRDVDIAAGEDELFVSKAMKNDKSDDALYKKKNEGFGLMILESDQDIPPVLAYRSYDDRWIEVVFSYYKGDSTLIGEEFINFISTLITCRIIHAGEKNKILEDWTYKEMMDELSDVWRKVAAPMDNIPTSYDRYWVNVFEDGYHIMEAFALCNERKKQQAEGGARA